MKGPVRWGLPFSGLGGLYSGWLFPVPVGCVRLGGIAYVRAGERNLGVIRYFKLWAQIAIRD